MSKYFRMSRKSTQLPPAYEGLQTSKEIEPPSAENLGTDNRKLKTPTNQPTTSLLDETTIKLLIFVGLAVILVYFLK